MVREKRVVITGIGPLASTGIGKEDFWEGIMNKETGIKIESFKANGALWDKFFLHKIEGFDIRRFDIGDSILDDLKAWKEGEEITDLSFLISSVKLALDDSNLKYDKNDNDIGLVITHENPGLEHFFNKICNDAFEMYRKKLKKIDFFNYLYQQSAKTAYDLQTFMFLFHISKIFGIHGYSLFLNNACASGLYALEAASQMIKTHNNSVVVVAGADNPRIYKYLWFKQLGLYAEDGKNRPFSKDSRGLVFGDGGVGLVLEDLEHALNRKAHIYAEYIGGGFSLEGWKVTIPASGSGFYQRAILKALEKSNTKKGDIDLICAHGVGNPVIDRYEAKAITDVFGDYPEKPLITAFKPYIGHTLGVSALIETAILIFCMDNNTVVPLLNCQNIDPQLRIKPVDKKINRELQITLKICSAFAGYNAAVVLKKYEA